MKFHQTILLAASFSLVGASCVLAASPAKPLQNGGVLSGQLTAMKNKKTKKLTYQITSEPRRLPAPGDLCNLETGPETFQLVANSPSDAAALKPYLGKTVSVKVNEMSCAQEAGQFSDAIVNKWAVVKQ